MLKKNRFSGELMYLTTLIRSEEPDIQKMVDEMLKKYN